MSARLGLATFVLACVVGACSFPQSDHPAACTRASDCERGYDCYRQFCVPRAAGSGTAGTKGGAGSAGNSGIKLPTAGTSGGAGAAGGSAGNAGSAGSAGSAGVAALLDASLPDGNGLDADSVDAAPAISPDYAKCLGNGDCNGPNQFCAVLPLGGTPSGFCSRTCASANDCPPPKGATATASCSNDGFCVLVCAGATCPTGLTCAAAICY